MIDITSSAPAAMPTYPGRSKASAVGSGFAMLLAGVPGKAAAGINVAVPGVTDRATASAEPIAAALPGGNPLPLPAHLLAGTSPSFAADGLPPGTASVPEPLQGPAALPDDDAPVATLAGQLALRSGGEPSAQGNAIALPTAIARRSRPAEPSTARAGRADVPATALPATALHTPAGCPDAEPIAENPTAASVGDDDGTAPAVAVAVADLQMPLPLPIAATEPVQLLTGKSGSATQVAARSASIRFDGLPTGGAARASARHAAQTLADAPTTPVQAAPRWADFPSVVADGATAEPVEVPPSEVSPPTPRGIASAAPAAVPDAATDRAVATGIEARPADGPPVPPTVSFGSAASGPVRAVDRQLQSRFAASAAPTAAIAIGRSMPRAPAPPGPFIQPSLAVAMAAPAVGATAPAGRLFAAAISAAVRQDREEPAAVDAGVPATQRLPDPSSASIPAARREPSEMLDIGLTRDPAVPGAVAADATTPSPALPDRIERAAAISLSLRDDAAVVSVAMSVPSAIPAPADHPALDMADRRWPGAMIAHIERLRDDADAGSTRLRVVPDALGSIDVSLHRHGDGAVQVTLSADQPETRALLADAHPELTRLAEARGVRLDTAAPAMTGGGSFTGGSWQGSDGQRRPSAPAMSARTSSSTDDEPADGRVA